MNPILRLCIVTLCVCAARSGVASDLPMPVPQQQHGVSYVTGGIGLDEVAAFQAAAQQYNLRITFSTKTGEYYAGVKLTLRDAHGNVIIETTSDGPFVFFNVLPGKYEVTAENLSQRVTRVVQVREKRGTELYIRWKALPDAQTQ
jgi:hypothetical protein